MTEKFKASKEAGYDTNIRNLTSYGSDYRTQQENYHSHDFDRRLGSSGGGKLCALHIEKRQRRISTMFCISLAVIFFCHDMMILCHKDVKAWFGICKRIFTKDKGRVSKGALFILLCHFLSFGFTATLWLYFNDPMHVVLLGLAMIALQILFRCHFFIRAQKDDESNTDGVYDKH